MYSKNKTGWGKHLDFLLLDALSLFAAFLLAFRFYMSGYFPEHTLKFLFSDKAYVFQLCSLTVIDLIVAAAVGTMKGVLKRGYLVELGYTLRNAVIVFAAEFSLMFGMQSSGYYSRFLLFWALCSYLLLSYLSRTVYKRICRKYIIPKYGQSLLIVTTADKLSELDWSSLAHSLDSFRMAGCVLLGGETSADLSKLPVVASQENAESWVRQNWVDEVLILMEPTAESKRLADACAEMGITVHFSMDLLNHILPSGKREMEMIGGIDVITVSINTISVLQTVVKRFFDILGGLIGCLLTLILSLFLAPAIELASPGPIFFSQKRVGRNGKIFRMYKFRSMVPDAEQRKAEFLDKNRVGDGRMFKMDFDPRIIGNKELPDGTRKTGVGDFIRRTSLDEFPQFFNVLKGDMSLVGTRPPTLDEWEKYEAHHRARMAMRPGITGMWQVSGRSEITDFEEVVRLDTKYISEWSLLLDLKILLKTIAVVFKREGSM